VPPLAGTGYCLNEYVGPAPPSAQVGEAASDSEQALRELVLALTQESLRLREELARVQAAASY
jgi:hypothetical protein